MNISERKFSEQNRGMKIQNYLFKVNNSNVAYYASTVSFLNSIFESISFSMARVRGIAKNFSRRDFEIFLYGKKNLGGISDFFLKKP